MNIRYRPEIDTLRAIAVLSVIAYHMQIYTGDILLFSGGFIGVDIFFVISGYLISSLILKEYEDTKSFSFKNFYKRRVKRLIPVLLFVIIVSIPFSLFVLYPYQLLDFSISLLTSIFFISNHYFGVELYGAESSLLKPFLHTWSLSVEEQFYLIFPIFFLFILKYYKSKAINILIICSILSFLFAEIGVKNFQKLNFFILPSRIWELLIGTIILFFETKKIYKDEIVLNFFILIGIILIIFPIFIYNINVPHPSKFTFLPVFGTAIIIYFSNSDSLLKRFLCNKVSVGIGLISYSLYLWHYPILAFLRVSENYSTSFNSIIITSLIIFLLSIFTYRFIETPFRSKKIHFNFLLKITTIFIFLISIFTYTSLINHGFKDRFSISEIYGKNHYDNQFLQKKSWSMVSNEKKFFFLTKNYSHKKYLGFTDKKNKKVLIVGNSHGKDFFNMFKQNQEEFRKLEFAYFGYQIPFIDDNKKRLSLENSPNFKNADIIILTSRWNFEEIKYLKKFKDLSDKYDKELILISKKPLYKYIDGKEIFDYFTISFNQILTVNDKKKIDSEYFNQQKKELDEINTKLNEAALSLNIKILNQIDYICEITNEQCEGITKDGYRIYFDKDHFTLEGAKYFGKKIFDTGWLNLDQK